MMFIAGSKEKYRHERDLYAIQSHVNKAQEICRRANVAARLKTSSALLPYDVLIELVSTPSVYLCPSYLHV